MQIKQTKIAAFTLMEIIITMVVSGIIITLVYSGINFFNRQMQKELVLKNELNNWHVERAQLFEDFYLANKIHKENDHTLKIQLSDKKEIVYEQIENKLVRTMQATSFQFKTELTNLTIVYTDTSKTVTFAFQIKEQQVPLYFSLEQTSSEKINNWIHEKLNDARY
jgi:prepilin-type N-terminal cleavage/methylation domain-containing protein